tara:strand:- start:3947 stop:4399 length:453 start_codon:yes stop_codon:yes gene_type:complete
MESYMPSLIDSKYHLSISKRMFETYKDFKDKRFLIGIINEIAKSSSNLIKAFLIYDGIKKERNSKKIIKIFMEKVGPKYLNQETIKNILKSLEIQQAQKLSRVEYARKDKIILLINGKYRVLTVKRLKELMESLEIGIKNFPQISDKYKK